MNIKGIDVSVWQGKIDWKKVKASGIVFAMIRVGYGSSQGNDCKMDTYFKANVEGALAAGVEVGIYFYSYAKSAQAAAREAAWVVEQIAPYKGRILYPVAYDLEDSKQAGLGRDVLTAMVTAFCTTIEAAGYYASFYCNTNWCKNMLNMDDLKGFDLWLAQWASQLPKGTRVAFGTSREQQFNLHTQETWTGSVLASLGLNVPAAMAGASMPSIGLEQLLAVNPAWLLVAHYREESIVKRWQQDPLWQMLTAAQKQQVASVDSNTWARMRGIFAAERIAADTVKIFHHQPLTVVK